MVKKLDDKIHIKVPKNLQGSEFYLPTYIKKLCNAKTFIRIIRFKILNSFHWRMFSIE